MVNTSHANRDFPYALLVVLRRVSAAVVTTVALYVSMLAYDVDLNETYQALLIIAALIALMLLPGRDANSDVLPPRFWSTSLSVTSRWFLLIGILLLLGYATKTSSIYSRRALLTWFMVTPPLLVLAQHSIELLVSRLLMSAGNRRRVVIAGAGDLGHQLAAKIQSSPLLGMKVEGFFDDRGTDRLTNGSSLPVLGNLKGLPGYVREHSTDLIFVVLPMRNIQRVTDLLDRLHDTTASIYFVPDVFVFDLIQCRMSDGTRRLATEHLPFCADG